MAEKSFKVVYKIDYLEEARKEYDDLDGSQLVFVKKGLNRIAVKGMQAGSPLHGDLEGCNKLKNRKMGLRIIFTQEDKTIKIIKIVAIGKRRRLEVYKNAVERLNSIHK